VGYAKCFDCAFTIFRNSHYSCVLSAAEYVQIDRGISIADVRHHYGVNESTIHFVRKNLVKISRIINHSAPLRAKMSLVIRRNFLPKTVERFLGMAGGLG
jgi:hypothetical protein